MLSRSSRLTSPADFQTALRRGRRAGSRCLVVHLALRPPVRSAPPAEFPASPAAPAPARVGFVVSKAVGGAVERNRVKRRLRHLCRDLLPDLPADSLLVVRALPAAATASSVELGEDLRAGVRRALGSAVRR